MLIELLVPELAGLYWGMNGVELTARIGPGRMVDRAPGAPFWELNEDVGVSFILKPGNRLCMIGLSLNRRGRLDDDQLQGDIQSTLAPHQNQPSEEFEKLQWESEDTKAVVNAPQDLMLADENGDARRVWGLTFIGKAEDGALLWWGGKTP